jgi:Bifunctional DNA primase/polymerase, N-terminal/AAA domain/Primase C terminal 1 (PriCT-1)
VTERGALFADYARRYAELGWALVRLDGKVPKGKGWQELEADPDPEHAAGLWSVWGERWNMGAVLGSAAVAVVEYDTEEGATRLRELFSGRRPLTPTAKTGSGRLHFYFRQPDDVAKAARDGVELRLGPHQCAVPPSEHPETGEPYVWLEGCEPWTLPLAEVPSALLEFFAEAHRDGHGAAPVADVIPEHGRNSTLTSLAGSMRRRGMGEAEILAALEVTNETRCRPPLAREELEKIARSVARYRPAQPGPEFLLRDLRDSEEKKESALGLSLPFARLSEALAKIEEQPDWLWRGYVARGVTSLLAGRPKVGKSTLVHALLAALERGSPFLGLTTAQAGVLLLTEEPLSAIRQKVNRFGLDSSNSRESLRAQETNSVHLLRRAQALKTPWPEVVEQALAYCLEHELGLLVIDTFDKWTGLRGDDENKTGAILQALEPLAQATAAGLAPFLITHQRKSGGRYGEAVRGGNALVGWADIVIELDRVPPSLDESRRQRVLSCIGRFDEVPDLVLELGDDSYAELGDVDEVRAKHEREQLLEAAREIGRPATVAEFGEELDVTESTARSRLHAAVRRGDLVRSGAGRKGDPFRWALPAGEKP